MAANTRASAAALAQICQASGPHLGVALDLNDSAWSRAEPALALSAIRKRLFSVRLPEAQMPPGRIEQWLAQIRTAGATPVFSTAAPDARAGIENFNAAVLKLPTN